MKTKKGSQSCPDKTIESTPKFNVVEIEFHNQDFTKIKRKIKIPHGQFSPPLVTLDHRVGQWFLWDKKVGVYREIEGVILSSIEVSSATD